MREKIRLVSHLLVQVTFIQQQKIRKRQSFIEIKKFDPVVRKHVLYKENKIK